MALIIEDGTIVAGADSFITRAEYIAWALAQYGDVVTDDDTADAALRRAASYLDGLTWKGSRTVGRGQSMQWPRLNMADCEGSSIASNEIPIEVKQAQFELTRVEYTTSGALSPSGSLRDAVVNSEKVDVIAVGYDTSRLTPDAVANSQIVVEAAMRRIRCFLVAGGKWVRMTDAVVV